MTSLTLDQLFEIAGHAPLLDEIEEKLRAKNESGLADSLMKFQQDAGVQIDREMNGYNEIEAASGLETAKLSAAYEPVTNARLDVLRRAHAILAPEQPDNILIKILEKFSGALDSDAPPPTPPNTNP